LVAHNSFPWPCLVFISLTMPMVAFVVFSLLHAGYGNRVRTRSQNVPAAGDDNAADSLAQLLLSLQPAAAYNVHPFGLQQSMSNPSSRPVLSDMQKRFDQSGPVMQDEASSIDAMVKRFADMSEEEFAEATRMSAKPVVEEEVTGSNTTDEEEEKGPTRSWRRERKFPRTPRMKALDAQVETGRFYEPEDAIPLLKKLANAKFTETVEFHAQMNLDPKYNDQQLRSTVSLPHGTGKDKRVAVLADGPMATEAEEAGADVVGMEDLVDDISAGKLDFDVLLATPPAMPKIAKLGRVLGPKGLMPSPKAGTVTTTVAKTVKEFKAGKLEFRMDKTANVHVPIGKVDFSEEKLMENLAMLVQVLQANKPKGAKGKMWKSATVCSSMGPGIKLDLNKLREYFLPTR